MRKVKNITVHVAPEIYRQARHLAAQPSPSVNASVTPLYGRAEA